MKTKKASKIFVLDTNVLLHDYRSMYSFEDNDVVIPIIVLEELDKFKKGHDLLNYHAREFARELDKLSGDSLFKDGVSLGKGRGKLFVETGKQFTNAVKESFLEHIPDHYILATADYVREQNKDRQVILVSKDINLRMKAKSIGVNAEDYKSDKVENVEAIYKDVRTIENFDKDIISRFYKEPFEIPFDDVKGSLKFKPHEYAILKNTSASALVHYDPFNQMLNRVEKKSVYGIEPRNAEQAFALDALLRKEVQLVAITGKAGTGKTLLALAAALYQRKNFTQIFWARPIVPLSNKDLGCLPGDAKDNITPYMAPRFDNLSFIKHQFKTDSADVAKIDELVKNEKLVISPLAYIRGRSLSNVFFIVDEAQNLTPHEIKTIITRAGEGTKMIFTGDIEQIDSPYLDTQSNGLSYLTDKMKGQNIFTHINLVRGERSYLAELASNLL